MSWLRIAWRFVAFGVVSSLALVEYACIAPWLSGANKRRYQAGWLHRNLKLATRAIGIRVHRRGSWPRTPLVVSNHLSYVDIFLLGSLGPIIFLSKDDVQQWPWGGRLATCGGTIYMKRLSASALLPVSRAITEAVADGVTVVLFLEGTTTDGSMVLPFHSALLEPAVKNKWQVTPCHIHYTSSLGQSADGVSWHGDVHFFAHLLRMLRIRRIDATAVFGNPVSHHSRKELASTLHREVSRLGRLVQRVPEPLE